MFSKYAFRKLFVAAVIVLDMTGAASAAGSGVKVTCNKAKTECNVYTSYKLEKPHLALATREVYPGVRPEIVCINGVWHSRFIDFNNTLREIKFREVKQ